MINTIALQKNMADQILEAQLKLGFVSETIRLYYPLSSLNHMLGEHFETAGELCSALQQICRESGTEGSLFPLQNVTFSHRGKRIEISIPPEATTYIHENLPEPAFLKAVIRLFSEDHHCTREKIEALFASYSRDYVLEMMPQGSDFDFSLHFADSSIDEYYYCIKMEMGHTIYHRFLEADYRELLD